MAFIGGRRHKSRKTRRTSKKNKRGGNVAGIVNQAVVPFGLLALNNMFSKRRKTKTHRKKTRRTKRR